ncbi:hypothetical protein BH20ACT2_BH20ACT2_02980 [soil metagenome]
MTVDRGSVGGEPVVELGVMLGFHGNEVEVSVRGELDLLTAPGLDGFLTAIVDAGHHFVVLDLAQLDFMDASGLRVIADTSDRLRPDGGSLTIRSAPTMVRLLLDITDVGRLVHLEPAEPLAASLGPEQRPGDHSRVVAGQPAERSSDLARVAAIPVGDEVVDAALRLVVALASATVGGADGVSVSLRRHGQISTVASTDETIAQMDRDQYATGQGPCLAAASEGHWFHVESLRAETRWPQFIPRAMQGGIHSILSTPLMVAAQPVGALNIYSNIERAFDAPSQELAALFATQASGILTDAAVDVSSEQATRRLHDALRSRAVIAQAQGVLMAREGCSADEAHATLRRSARRDATRVRERAAEIMATCRDVAPTG